MSWQDKGRENHTGLEKPWGCRKPIRESHVPDKQIGTEQELGDEWAQMG